MERWPDLDEFIFGAEVRYQDVLSIHDTGKGYTQSSRCQCVGIRRQVSIQAPTSRGAAQAHGADAAEQHGDGDSVHYIISPPPDWLKKRMAESEVDTPSTPIEYESKYFEHHGVRLPPFCRGKMDEIDNFSLRSSDIWIVTYPKSGTSLLQEVVYLVSQGADPDEIGLMNIDEQLPVLEYPQPGLEIIQELTSPRLIKSHLPYRFLPSAMHNGEGKVIYMARNPKDLVVSYYQFHRSLRTMSYRGTFQEFCRRFMNDKLGYGSWFEHVQEFWEHRMDSNVLFLKYEDMYKRSWRAWWRAATNSSSSAVILKLSPSAVCMESWLAIMMKHLSAYSRGLFNISTDEMEKRQMGAEGRVGLWKDIFTVSMNEKFDAIYRQKMAKSDLNFDFIL
ncbi:hypothetical protein DNTS_008129 [Danionella cerebrum]|uniref:Sulfotransferase n=1 Tax=Danionella cerebrum TaxID=2873325 RepID=A0A553P0Z8_9TELE|nr:hypothetical protein DNTS_008129 [Danionella translucida]